MRKLMLATLIGLSAATAQADTGITSNNLNLSISQDDFAAPLLLASADNPAGSSSRMTNNEAGKMGEFEEQWFTGSKAHKYLGLGSLGLAALAAISPKEEDGPHEYFAKGAAALGTAAVASGLTYHYGDLHFKQGFSDPDNLHALLGIIGTLGYIGAVSKAPEGGHGGLGVIGAISMAYAIKITW